MITWFVVSAGRASAPWFKEKIMKYITVKISEIQDHPTKRMDAKYWIKKKKKATSSKRQATSGPEARPRRGWD